MKVRAYTSAKFDKVKEYRTHRIELLGDDPLTKEDKKSLYEGDLTPMFNFQYYNAKDDREEWISIPCEYILSVTND